MFHLTSHLMRLKLAVAITFLTLFSLAARAQFEGQEVQEQATRPGERQLPKDPTMFGPVVWSMVATPIHPVRGTDWRIHLIYELHVTNASQEEDTVRINSIEVLDARNDRVTGDSHVISPDGQDVTGKVLPFWKFNSKGDAVDFTDRLGPGQGGIVYFDVTYDAPKDVPRRLKHRFVVSSDKHPKITTVVDGGTKVTVKAPRA